ncbi:hypothetical protein QTN25_001596 [Entamoeba marina]
MQNNHQIPNSFNIQNDNFKNEFKSEGERSEKSNAKVLLPTLNGLDSLMQPNNKPTPWQLPPITSVKSRNELDNQLPSIPIDKGISQLQSLNVGIKEQTKRDVKEYLHNKVETQQPPLKQNISSILNTTSLPSIITTPPKKKEVQLPKIEKKKDDAPNKKKMIIEDDEEEEPEPRPRRVTKNVGACTVDEIRSRKMMQQIADGKQLDNVKYVETENKIISFQRTDEELKFNGDSLIPNETNANIYEFLQSRLFEHKKNFQPEFSKLRDNFQERIKNKGIPDKDVVQDAEEGIGYELPDPIYLDTKIIFEVWELLQIKQVPVFVPPTINRPDHMNTDWKGSYAQQYGGHNQPREQPRNGRNYGSYYGNPPKYGGY